MPLVRMSVMLGKPGVPHAQLIGQLDQIRHFIKDRRRGLVSRSFKMVGQPDLEHAHDAPPSPCEMSSNTRLMTNLPL